MTPGSFEYFSEKRPFQKIKVFLTLVDTSDGGKFVGQKAGIALLAIERSAGVSSPTKRTCPSKKI